MTKYEFLKPLLPSIEECLPYWQDIYARGQFTNSGLYANRLESDIAKYLGVKHAVVVANGTLALMLAIKAVSPRRRQVLVPSFTFAATVSSLVWMGYEPKFVDVDDTMTMDPRDLRNKIDENCGLVVAVNSFGSPCEVETIEGIASEHQLGLIFDSAGAFGAEYKNEKLGRFGNAECFSLHATKNFAVGEGGFIATNDEALYSKLVLYRNFGISDGDIVDEGINAKISEFAAVLGIMGLPKTSESLDKRRLLARKYRANLAHLPIRFPRQAGSSSYQLFPILVDNRDQLKLFLDTRGIYTRVYYHPLLNRTDIYQRFAGATPFADKVSRQVLCLPMYSSLNENDIDSICEVICQFYETS